MRHIGSLSDELDSHRFTSYLVTKGIAARTERDNGDWAIWVLDENDVASAREQLEEFRANPSDTRYDGVERAADSIRREQHRRHEQIRKNVVEMRGRWGRGVSARRAPLVFALIGLSVLVAIWTNFGSNANSSVLLFRDRVATKEAGQNVFASIQQGQVWRLVSPVFLHLGFLHLVFNMYWTYYLGAQIEDRRGTLRFVALVLAIAVTSNVAQAVIETPDFGGMSGVAFGLFGYVWMKSSFDPSSGLYISRGNVLFIMIYFFACLSSFMGPIANTAHGVGLGVGVAVGYAPEIWKGIARK